MKSRTRVHDYSTFRSEDDQRQRLDTNATVQTAERDMNFASPAGTYSEPHRALSASTLLSVQRTFGNATVRRMLSERGPDIGCNCPACTTRESKNTGGRSFSSVRRAAPTLSGLTNSGFGLVQRCAACQGKSVDEPANTAQRWPWDDEESEQPTEQPATQPATSGSSGSSSGNSDSGGSGWWPFDDANDAPQSTEQPANSGNNAGGSSASGSNTSGGSSWWPFGDESDSPQTEQPASGGGSSWWPFDDSNDTPQSGEQPVNTNEGDGESGGGGWWPFDNDDEQSGGERAVTVPSSKSYPSVVDYGKAGVYDAEGYCSWDNIESDISYTINDVPGGVKASGNATLTFTSTANYTLPSVPAAITNECEKKKYQTAIDTTLRAHEEQHKAAFLTYNGTLAKPINISAKDDTELKSKAGTQILDPVTDARYNAAKTKSSAVDPAGGFKFTPDLSGC